MVTSCKEEDFEAVSGCTPIPFVPQEDFVPGPRIFGPDEGDPEAPPGPTGPLSCTPELPPPDVPPDDPQMGPRITIPRPPPGIHRVIRVDRGDLQDVGDFGRGIGGVLTGGTNFNAQGIPGIGLGSSSDPNQINAEQLPILNAEGQVIGWRIEFRGFGNGTFDEQTARFRLEDYNSEGALVSVQEKDCTFTVIDAPVLVLGTFQRITHGALKDPPDSQSVGSSGTTLQWQSPISGAGVIGIQIRGGQCRDFDPDTIGGSPTPPWGCTSTHNPAASPFPDPPIVEVALTGSLSGTDCWPSRFTTTPTTDPAFILWWRGRWDLGGGNFGPWSGPVKGPVPPTVEDEPLHDLDSLYCTV